MFDFIQEHGNFILNLNRSGNPKVNNLNMQEVYNYIFVYITLIIISAGVLFSLYGVGKILEWFRGKIKKFIEGTKKTEFVSCENYKKSLRSANLIKEREKNLGWITKIVTIIELIMFGGLTLLLILEKNFQKDFQILGTMKTFGAFLGGWLGIKVLSSHGAWSDPIAGKAYYHISLFGTLLNVGVAFLAALLSYYFASSPDSLEFIYQYLSQVYIFIISNYVPLILLL